tara:strand:- start:405 stop:821 length:417 start_codon:yes stop_codon:yes gene_type:complete
MKKVIFLVIISLALQGFSQVKSGVYKINETLDFTWKNGEQVGDAYLSNEPFLMHIADNGFRIYRKHADTGNSYPMVYMGLDPDGYHIYAVPFGDRFEMKDDIAVFFFNFNNDTGWYESSTEWRGLEYVSKVPILEYEN